MSSPENAFDHEKLRVYQAAISFVGWCAEVFDGRKTGAAMRNQFERATASIPLNIAEGNGKFSGRDKGRFLEIARGSALECAACLDVLVARSGLPKEISREGKEQLIAIVSMLTRMISVVTGRMAEDGTEYAAGDSSVSEA